MPRTITAPDTTSFADRTRKHYADRLNRHPHSTMTLVSLVRFLRSDDLGRTCPEHMWALSVGLIAVRYRKYVVTHRGLAVAGRS